MFKKNNVSKELWTHFLKTIFKSKGRQKLLILAAIGLVLSSFSLLFLQGIMGGLQQNLKLRSKNAIGIGQLDISRLEESEIVQLEHSLSSELRSGKNSEDTFFHREYELEVLVKNGVLIRPVILHGIDLKNDKLPWFLDQEVKGLALPFDLQMELKVSRGELVSLISPAHVDLLLGDRPRMISRRIDQSISTEVPEVDAVHGWIPIQGLWNLIKGKFYNRIRLYGPEVSFFKLIENMKDKNSDIMEKVSWTSWEEQNKSLVYALGLETAVMVFLFASMTLLIGLSLSAGLNIFLDKIKVDLTSLWILGAGEAKIESIYKRFFWSFGPICIFTGCFLGGVALILLKQSNLMIMPEIFVERRVPVSLNLKQLLLSVFIPISIYAILVLQGLRQFKKIRFIEYVRITGR